MTFKTVEEWKEVLMNPGPEYGKPKNSVDLSARVSVEVWLLISHSKMQLISESLLLAEIEKVYEAYFWLQPRNFGAFQIDK